MGIAATLAIVAFGVPMAAPGESVVGAQVPDPAGPAISFELPRNTPATSADFPGGEANNEISFPNLASGDMNGDGFTDLVAAWFPNCCGANGGVAVMLGLGDGTFGEPTPSALTGPGANRVMGVGLGDFDEDGDLDVFGTVPQRQEFDVWLNDGSGRLGAPSFTPLTARPGDDVKVVDLDGDSTLDVVAGGSQDGSITALYGRGDGTFEVVPVATGQGTVMAVVVGDFDGQNALDIAWSAHFSRNIVVAASTGPRSYTTTTTSIPFVTASHLFSADLDADGEVDLGLVGWTTSQAPLSSFCNTCVTTLRGNGDGTFSVPPATDLAAYAQAPDSAFGDNTGFGWGPYSPDPADLDGDGDFDLVMALPSTEGLVLVARNDGEGGLDVDTYVGIADNSGTRVGTYQINADYVNGTGQFVRGLVVEDFNGDGAVDLAVAGEEGGAFTANRGAIAVVQGDAEQPGEFLAPRISAASRSSDFFRGGFALADWDGDGDQDVLAPRFSDSRVMMFENLGEGRFTDAVDVQAGLRGTYSCIRTGYEQALESGDLDGDGNDDIVCRGANAAGRYTINIWYGDGAGGADLVTVDTYDGAVSMPPLHLVDVDGDGDRDLLDTRATRCGPCQMSTSMFRNNGDRTFDALPTVEHGPVDQFQLPVVPVDVDNDGDLDLVARPGIGTNPPLKVHRNNGSGLFAAPSDSQPVVLRDRNLAVHSMVAGDLNRDGNEDLVIQKSWDYRSNIGAYYPGGLFVMLGRGDATFADPVEHVWGGGGGMNEGLVDLDLDGNLDLPINPTHWGVETLRGRGDGAFEPVQRSWAGTAWNYQARAVDLNGDRKPEIVKMRSDSFALVVLRNSSGGVPAGPAPDLSVTAVDVAATVTPGASATVRATVRNSGGRSTGRWTDQVWLSADDTIDADDRLLGSVERSGVAAGATYDVEVTTRFDPLRDGAHRVLVRADARRQLAETDETDNVAASPGTVTLDIDEMAVAEASNQTVAAGQVRYLRIPGPTPQLGLSLESDVGDVADVEIVRGRVPVPARQVVLGDPGATRRSVSLPAGSGDWFLRIVGRPGAGTGVAVSLIAEALEFGLFGVSPARGSNLGTATVVINGVGFTSASRVRLIDGPAGAASRSAGATAASPEAIAATLDLRGVPAGRYDVEVTSVDGRVAVLGDAFTVTTGAAGRVELYTSAPPSLRPGWAGEYVVTVRNTGDTDLTIDSLVVRGTAARLRLPNRSGYSDREAVFLPGDPDGPLGPVPAGVVPPGSSRRVVIEFAATADDSRLTAELYVHGQAAVTADPPTGLVVDQVEGPSSVTSGDSATVQFRLRNTGTARLAGPWTLATGLVGDPEFLNGSLVVAPRFSDTAAITIGSGVAIDPGETFAGSASITVPDAPDGPARWIVGWPGADPRIVTQVDDVFTTASFDDDPADAVGWSTDSVSGHARGISASAPLALGLAPGESRLLRLDTPTGPTRVRIESSGAEPIEVSAAAGAVPAGGATDDDTVARAGTPGVIELVTSPVADYLVVGPAGPSGASVQLSVTTPEPGLETIAPLAAGNAGDATVELRGVALDQVTAVDLVAGDGTRAAARSWNSVDEFHGSATFDLRGLTPGGYRIELSRAAGDPLGADFVVTAGGSGDLEVDVVPPNRMRTGVPNPVTVNYSNTGSVDIPLPLLTLQAREGGRIGVITERADADNDTTFIPPSPVSGAAVLPPGSTGTMTLWYTPPARLADEVTFDIWATDFADPTLADDPMDWASIGAATKPPEADDAAWTAHLAEERARYGETYGDLSDYVAGEYSTLASLGLERAVFADGEWLFFARTGGRPGTFRSGSAVDHAGVAAAPAAREIRQTSARLFQADPQLAEGDGIQNVRAVVVANPDGTLPGASRDARQFSSLLTKTYNIPKARVTSLEGAEATPQATFDAINRYKNLGDSDDLLVVMVSTHGTVDYNDPSNAARAKNLLAGREVTASEWNTALAGSPSKVLFVLDTCNSANITQFVTAPNVTSLASSDFGQSVPDDSYTQVLVQELQRNPRGDFYAIAQRAGDRQLERGYGDKIGTLTAAGRDFVATWRNSTIDRPADFSGEAVRAARQKVKEHGFDERGFFRRGGYVDPATMPVYPTLDRRGNTTLQINPPDPKKAATTARGDKQKQLPPTKTKKGKVDAGVPVKKPSNQPGKEGEVEEEPVTRGTPTASQTSSVPTFRSFDPNEVVGPSGVGPGRWVSSEAELAYEVRFENLGPGSTTIPPGRSVATAPAALVDVETTLDPDVNLTTFSLGDFGVGNGNTTSGYPTARFSPPPGAQGFSQDLAVKVPVFGTAQPPVDLILRGEAWLDPVTRRARWTVTALDPVTLAIPANPLLGFLPPEDGTNAGQGFVRYRASAVIGSGTGTAVNARASIVFDANDPIVTNEWVNRLDAEAPSAAVTPLPAASPTSIPVAWSGTDPGAGVAIYDVFVSVDGGPMTPWLVGESGTSRSYPGVSGRRYGFAVRATDAVGRAGPTPTQAQQSTLATDTPPTTTTPTSPPTTAPPTTTPTTVKPSVAGQSVVADPSPRLIVWPRSTFAANGIVSVAVREVSGTTRPVRAYAILRVGRRTFGAGPVAVEADRVGAVNFVLPRSLRPRRWRGATLVVLTVDDSGKHSVTRSLIQLVR